MAEEKNLASQQNKDVEQLIFTDDLTGAFNRRYLYQYLPQEMSRCQAGKQSLWLFMIDVDDFKAINDTYGHLKGDEVLKGVVEILKESVRSADTVIRYAGDEFTVIVSSAEIATASAVAKRMMTKISARVFSGDGKQDFNVHLSIGIANFPEDSKEVVGLINMSDRALYVSKQKGKNCISFVSDLPEEMLIARTILDMFPCPKLIERERHLEVLKNSFAKVKNENKAQAVLVSGGVGTGKSRLLEEFLQIAKAQGYTMLSRRCSEKSAPYPFRAFLTMWEAFLKKNKMEKATVLQGLSTEEAGAIEKASLTIKTLYGPGGTKEAKSAEGPESEGHIMAALRKISVNLTRTNKVCMVIDDFQWTDIGTLNLIATLKDQEAPIFICCLIRENELNRQAEEMPLVQFKDELAEFFSDKISVDNISLDGATEMIKNIFAKLTAGEKFYKLLYKISSGNPLFIEELLKFMIQKGSLFNHNGQWEAADIQEADLPRSLQDVILERIKGLDKPAQEIIAKAAVLGQDFSSEMLGRLGKVDEGYLLDILESAKSVGLIRENIPVDTEETLGNNMSFANEEIRRAIADLISQEEIKDLHRQVGEMQENLNADNLGDVASDLFYHFKKSQDFERAQRYADMFMETGGAFQDQAVEYARRILEEREEKAYPLSKKSLKLISDICRLFYIININVTLYPSGSEMIAQPLDDLFRKFSEVFARDETVVLKDYKGSLVVNGEKLKESDLKAAFSESILSLFKERNVESVAFKRGMSRNEMTTFIDVFAEVKEDKSISEILKSKLIFKIRVKEVDYAAAGEEKSPDGGIAGTELLQQLLGQAGEMAVGQEGLLDKLKKRPGEVTSLLNQFADSVVKKNPADSPLSNERVRVEALTDSVNNIGEQIRGSNINELDNYRKGLATAITKLDPRLRKDVLSHDKFASSHNDVIKEVAPYFSDEIISDVFIEEFKQKKASSTRLKSLVGRFIPEEKRRKELLPKLKKELEGMGLSQDDSEWAFGEKKWQNFDLEEKLGKFLQMSVHDYLNLEQEVDIVNLGSEIIKHNSPELLERFLKKWEEFFRVEDFSLRKLIVMNFSNIVESIPPAKEETLVALINFIFSQIQKELNSEIYAVFLSQLATPLDHLLSARYFNGLKALLTQLDKEKSRFEFGVERIAVQAIYDKILDKKQIGMIINELFSRIDKNLFYFDISDIIILIGQVMIKPLLETMIIEEGELSRIGYFGVYLRRRSIGEILASIAKRNGYETIAENLKEKLEGGQPAGVKIAVDLIVYLQQPELCGLLSVVVGYPDAEVRKKVALALSKFPDSKNVAILNGMLNDEDTQVRLHAINLLGKVGDRSSLDLLKNLKDEENQEVVKVAKDILENKLGKI